MSTPLRRQLQWPITTPPMPLWGTESSSLMCSTSSTPSKQDPAITSCGKSSGQREQSSIPDHPRAVELPSLSHPTISKVIINSCSFARPVQVEPLSAATPPSLFPSRPQRELRSQYFSGTLFDWNANSKFQGSRVKVILWIPCRCTLRRRLPRWWWASWSKSHWTARIVIRWRSLHLKNRHMLRRQRSKPRGTNFWRNYNLPNGIFFCTITFRRKVSTVWWTWINRRQNLPPLRLRCPTCLLYRCRRLLQWSCLHRWHRLPQLEWGHPIFL